MPAAVVETDKQLVAAQRPEKLGLVVGQPSVPSSVVEFEETLEPLVEGFDGLGPD